MVYHYPYPYYYDSYRQSVSGGGTVVSAPAGVYGRPGVSAPGDAPGSAPGVERAGFGSRTFRLGKAKPRGLLQARKSNRVVRGILLSIWKAA